jgi:hypothetical protein
LKNHKTHIPIHNLPIVGELYECKTYDVITYINNAIRYPGINIHPSPSNKWTKDDHYWFLNNGYFMLLGYYPYHKRDYLLFSCLVRMKKMFVTINYADATRFLAKPIRSYFLAHGIKKATSDDLWFWKAMFQKLQQ